MAVAAVIADRLQGKRVAVVLDHEFSGPFVDDLRGWLAQSGAEVSSITVVTKRFVGTSEANRKELSNEFEFYPPADSPFVPALAGGHPRAISSVVPPPQRTGLQWTGATQLRRLLREPSGRSVGGGRVGLRRGDGPRSD